MYDIKNRRKFILEAVISSYIDTAEPVGSGTLQHRFNMDLSSASIRNVLAELEKEGYIAQPHTSAGRIPTDKGYRYYIDGLMPAQELEEEEKNFIEEEYDIDKTEMEETIEKTSHVLSQITKQAGIVLFPSFQQSCFERIQLVSVTPKLILVVLMTNSGVVRNKAVRLEEDVTQDDLDKIGRFLNDELYGMPLGDIKAHLLKKTEQENGSFFYISRRAAEIIRLAVVRNYPLRISLDGTSYILEKPEFQDIARTKLLLKLFENKEQIQDLMCRDMSEQNMKVYIGSENRCECLNECTFITQGYRLGERVVGRLGIIGPRRMPYAKMMAVVDYISKIVGHNLENMNR